MRLKPITFEIALLRFTTGANVTASRSESWLMWMLKTADSVAAFNSDFNDQL